MTCNITSGCVNSETEERYREAETWFEYGKCVECMCEKSGPKCHELMCPAIFCDAGEGMRTETVDCCPRCFEPCVEAASGKVFEDGESWMRDPCTTCGCVMDSDGIKQEVCATSSCLMPEDCKTQIINVPDQCCPICEDPCTDEEGIKYDIGDSWQPDPCTFCTCMLTQDGTRLKECSVTACALSLCHTHLANSSECCPRCPCIDSDTGREYAIGAVYSSEVDPCTVCECTDIGPLCQTMICEVPDCGDVTVWGEGMKAMVLPGQCCSTCVASCVDELGIEYEVGEFWFRMEPPCMECECEGDGQQGKREVCSKMTCPAIEGCATRISNFPDQCCPFCVEPCTDKEGIVHEIGGSWKLDACTECLCEVNSDGVKEDWCMSMDCARLEDCKTTIFELPDECCPICADLCSDNNGRQYEIGESWKLDACTTCFCQLDSVGVKVEHCSATDCPEIHDCKTEIQYPPNQCCSVCAEDCSVAKCPGMLDCKYGTYTPPGTCCPVCMEVDCRVVRCAGVQGCKYGSFTPPGECCSVCMEDDCSLVDCQDTSECDGTVVQYPGDCCSTCSMTDFHYLKNADDSLAFGVDFSVYYEEGNNEEENNEEGNIEEENNEKENNEEENNKEENNEEENNESEKIEEENNEEENNEDENSKAWMFSIWHRIFIISIMGYFYL